MSNFCINCGSKTDETTGACECCSETKNAPEVSQTQTSGLKVSGKKTFINILLSIILSFVVLICFIVLQIRSSLPAAVSKTVAKMDFEAILDELSTSEEKKINNLYRHFARHYDATVDDDMLVEFLDEVDLSEFVGEKVGSVMSDIIDGKTRIVLEADDIAQFLKENRDSVESELDLYLDSDGRQNVAEYILGDDKLVLLSSKNSSLIPLAQTFLSYIFVAILAVLAGFCILFMIKNNLLLSLSGIGISFISVGSITAVISLILAWLPLNAYSLMVDIVFAIISNLLINNILLSLVLILVGIIPLVIKKMLNRKAIAKSEN